MNKPNIKHVTRLEYINLVEGIDKETKEYAINDCLKCWDDKRLWQPTNLPSSPVVMLNDEGELLSVIFPCTEIVHNEESLVMAKIAYIQRLFTPKKFRKQGNFTKLLSCYYEHLFDTHYAYIKMFIDKEIELYKHLNFHGLFDTKDGKYSFCMQPIVHQNMIKNNNLVAKEKLENFYQPSIIQYIDKMKAKYE
jgi:hypothetical protein